MNDLLDIHGNSLLTYKDEECIAMMEAVLYQDDPYEIIPDKKVHSYSINIEKLPKDDKDLLLEYASKLFNTLQKGKTDPFGNTINLYYAIYQLVNDMVLYRLTKSGEKKIALAKEIEPLNKKAKQEKEKYLQDHAKAILKMIGGSANTSGGSPNSFDLFNLKKYLEDIVKLPSRYLPIHPKGYFRNKNIIKENLIELELPLKANIINEFIKKIK